MAAHRRSRDGRQHQPEERGVACAQAQYSVLFPHARRWSEELLELFARGSPFGPLESLTHDVQLFCR